MNPQNTFCIVPRLPPAIDGVGDYALNLAQRLRQDCDLNTHFIVGQPDWQGAGGVENFPVSMVKERSTAALLTLLPTSSNTPIALLVHYVGYGYAQRGCPVWLVKALERWKANNPNARIVTMFHEVAAFGPPWSSAFWLSPVQKNLAARLIKLSDRALTSKQLYAKILSQLSQVPQTSVTTLPVFSNVGEPTSVPPLANRKPHLVVFGGRSNRLRVYQESLPVLDLICQQLKIEKILDIGPPTDLNLLDINGVPVLEMGQRSVAEISQILLNSIVAFFNYPVDFLAKSTIFAAYCAHGILPASAQESLTPVDGIEAGKHYWKPDSQNCNLEIPQMQAIADRAYTWYHNHDLTVQAQTFADCITGKPTNKSIE